MSAMYNQLTATMMICCPGVWDQNLVFISVRTKKIVCVQMYSATNVLVAELQEHSAKSQDLTGEMGGPWMEA